jgi:small subunit ribosomal protein S21
VTQIEVKVRKGESLEKAMRRLKRRLDRENVIRDVKARRYFEKPCDRRRRKEKVAKFTNFLRNRREKE